MNSEVEFHIRNNSSWLKLPVNVQQILGNSPKEYEKSIVNFSIKNQLRYRGNLIKNVKKDERRYYEELLAYSKESLMLYPYHLSDVVVKGLRVTPFQYYVSVMENIMEQEKSYDSLPNFTAADCLRLLGIGRNEYIELMNQCRSGRKLFRRKNVKDLLPTKPAQIIIEPWWKVHIGCVIEEDIKLVSQSEKNLLDLLIDDGPQRAGDLDINLVHSLYKKGLIYLDVPIEDEDYIIVPPLEGFVMNRVLGDYFETLLYKIFVSIDEHTSVGELASVLQIDPKHVKNAVSLYCRLGFARRKSHEADQIDTNHSWKSNYTFHRKSCSEEPEFIELNASVSEITLSPPDEAPSGPDETEPNYLLTSTRTMRIAFIFDSTLTAFLMMGNLTPGLKNHAVTMFEVGKLSDESLDNFLAELEKISTADSEGEAQRYFDHALILRLTILFLRHNSQMEEDLRLPVDLVRCESLQSLDPAICSRLLSKNYALLVSMAPLSKEIRPISSCVPPHFGPAIPEVNTVWFKLFIYHVTGYGPPSLLLIKGTRIRRLPSIFLECDKLLVTTWGHDPVVLPLSNIVITLNEALCHSATLVQAYGVSRGAETSIITFPLSLKDKLKIGDSLNLHNHPAVQKLAQAIDLVHNCGYITMVNVTNGLNSDKHFIQGDGDLNLHIHNSVKISTNDSDGLVESWVKNINSFEQEINSESKINSENTVTVFDPERTVPPDKSLLNLCNSASITEDAVGMLNFKVSNTKQVKDNWMQWTLLDCSFGIPLFDETINKEICDSIIKCQLYKKQSLDQLTFHSRKLCLNLLEFIAQFQDLPVLPDEQCVSSNKRTNNPSVVLPTRNLLFVDGKLGNWNGK